MNLSGTRIARSIHLVSTAWIFILISMHIGMHWNQVVLLINKKLTLYKQKKLVFCILQVLLCLFVGFGIYVFISRNFYEEMFLLINFNILTTKQVLLYI